MLFWSLGAHGGHRGHALVPDHPLHLSGPPAFYVLGLFLVFTQNARVSVSPYKDSLATALSAMTFLRGRSSQVSGPPAPSCARCPGMFFVGRGKV